MPGRLGCPSQRGAAGLNLYCSGSLGVGQSQRGAAGLNLYCSGSLGVGQSLGSCQDGEPALLGLNPRLCRFLLQDLAPRSLTFEECALQLSQDRR